MRNQRPQPQPETTVAKRHLRAVRSTPRTDAAAPLLEPPAVPQLLEGPSRDALVRQHAYARYERNGCIDGHALDDWLAAEAEVGAMHLSGQGNAPAEPMEA
jgi:hypothetical protein